MKRHSWKILRTVLPCKAVSITSTYAGSGPCLGLFAFIVPGSSGGWGIYGTSVVSNYSPTLSDTFELFFSYFNYLSIPFRWNPNGCAHQLLDCCFLLESFYPAWPVITNGKCCRKTETIISVFSGELYHRFYNLYLVIIFTTYIMSIIFFQFHCFHFFHYSLYPVPVPLPFPLSL